MGTIQEAESVLLEAESKLQELLKRALKAQQYSEVAQVARMTEEVRRIVRGLSGPHTPASSRTESEFRPRRKQRRKGIQNNGRTYPVFERDGDRLVKVGWSKKNRVEYEHRASRKAVTAFVQHLARKVCGTDLFDMEGLLPVPDSTGGDVPDYQSYLTLRWLQEVGVVEKRGRDGYVLRTPSLGEAKLEELWSAVPIRK